MSSPDDTRESAGGNVEFGPDPVERLVVGRILSGLCPARKDFRALLQPGRQERFAPRARDASILAEAVKQGCDFEFDARDCSWPDQLQSRLRLRGDVFPVSDELIEAGAGARDP